MFDSQPVVLFWEVIRPRWRMWAPWSQLWEFPLTPSFQFAAFALLPVAVDVLSPLPAPVTCWHAGPAVVDPYLPMLWGSSFFLTLPLARHWWKVFISQGWLGEPEHMEHGTTLWFRLLDEQTTNRLFWISVCHCIVDYIDHVIRLWENLANIVFFKAS